MLLTCGQIFGQASLETLQMMFVTGIIAGVLGLILGIILLMTDEGWLDATTFDLFDS
jgi:ABC-type methionine transport system permease subunit